MRKVSQNENRPKAMVLMARVGMSRIEGYRFAGVKVRKSNWMGLSPDLSDDRLGSAGGLQGVSDSLRLIVLHQGDHIAPATAA